MGHVEMDKAAEERQRRSAPSRAACWVCGLRESASIHVADRAGSRLAWHVYVPAILTRLDR